MTKWVTKKLGEIASLQGGFAFQSKDFADDGIPLIRIGDITAKGLNTNNSAKLPSYFLDEHTEFALKADDTIIAMSGATVGKCTLVTEKDIPALLNQRVGRFKVKNCIDKKFVYYTVSNYSYQQKLLLDAIGGAQPNVSPRQIESVLCPIPIKADGTPDLAEQKRIAGILSSADGAIAASEALIEKYRNIKRGLLATLLQPKEGWKKVKLGEIGDFYVGGDVDKSCFSAYPTMECKYPIYANALVNEGLYGYSSKYEFDKEAVTITGRGDVGKVFYRKPYFSTIIRLVTLVPNNPDIDVKFLSYAMSKINFIIESTGVPQLTAPQAKKYEIYIPNLAEQRRIADILSSVDAKIAAEEKVVEKYKGVKKGLMEELMGSEKIF